MKINLQNYQDPLKIRLCARKWTNNSYFIWLVYVLTWNWNKHWSLLRLNLMLKVPLSNKTHQQRHQVSRGMSELSVRALAHLRLKQSILGCEGTKWCCRRPLRDLWAWSRIGREQRPTEERSRETIRETERDFVTYEATFIYINDQNKTRIKRITQSVQVVSSRFLCPTLNILFRHLYTL